MTIPHDMARQIAMHYNWNFAAFSAGVIFPRAHLVLLLRLAWTNLSWPASVHPAEPGDFGIMKHHMAGQLAAPRVHLRLGVVIQVILPEVFHEIGVASGQQRRFLKCPEMSS